MTMKARQCLPTIAKCTRSSCANRSTQRRPIPQLQHRRRIQIKAAPATLFQGEDQIASPDTSELTGAESPDARFEVIGTPNSLLSVSLSASQNLYTRRGTLVAVSGKPENALSTLSLLSPIRRAVLGVPFLYQRISSTSPITALIGSKGSSGSFAVVGLDGTVDWMVAQRNGLLAWTGHSLAIKPTIKIRASLAQWGNSIATGRGLVALVAQGQVYQIILKAKEEFVVHPSNVVAYTISGQAPSPYRLKSSSLRLQIPSIKLFAEPKFITVMRESDTWRFITKTYFILRTWSRRTIWGDRLFLRFEGPTTILLQSRASSLRDVLTSGDVDEIAQAEPGSVQAALRRAESKAEDDDTGIDGKAQARRPSEEGVQHPRLRVASVKPGGAVKFEKREDLSEFVPGKT